MNRSLYIAATGMNAQQAQMDVISNNLANVSTNGFKGSRAVFEDLLYQTIRQPGANSTQNTELRRASSSARVCSRSRPSVCTRRQPAADRQLERHRHQRPGLFPGADA